MSLSSQQLAYMRRVKAGFQTGTAVIQRSTGTQSESGYPEDNFAAVGTVACRILPLSRQAQQMVANQELGRSYYTASLAYTATVRDGDRIVAGGVTYEVAQIDNDRTDETDVQVILVKFGNG